MNSNTYGDPTGVLFENRLKIRIFLIIQNWSNDNLLETLIMNNRILSIITTLITRILNAYQCETANQTTCSLQSLLILSTTKYYAIPE